MADTGFKPQNFRIFRRVTKTRIIVIEDYLTVGKVRWNLVEYKKGDGSQADVVHFMDWQRAAFLAWDVLHHQPRPSNEPNGQPAAWWNGYREYKGTRRDDELHARTFTVEIVGANNPFKLTITNGPGEPVGNDGAIKPATGADQTSVSVLLPWSIAREMALALHSHLQAWQTMTYYQRIQAGTWQPPDDRETHLVDTDTGEIIGTGFGKATGAPKDDPPPRQD